MNFRREAITRDNLDWHDWWFLLFVLMSVRILQVDGELLPTMWDQTRICHPKYHPVYNKDSPFEKKCPALCRMNRERKAKNDDSFVGPYEYELARADLGWYNLNPCSKCKAVGIWGVCIELYCRERAACLLLNRGGPSKWKQ